MNFDYPPELLIKRRAAFISQIRKVRRAKGLPIIIFILIAILVLIFR